MSVNINHQLEEVNNLKIIPTGVGATVGTAGIVTYYGDGSQLSGTGGTLIIEDEGTPLTTSATTINFVGAGVTATGTGSTKTVTIAGGGGGGTSGIDEALAIAYAYALS